MATTKKSLSTVRTRVRDKIDESSASYWTDAELNRAINEAKDELVNFISTIRQDFFEANSTLSITADQSPPLFTLPDDFLTLRSLRVTTSGYTGIRFTPSDRQSQAFLNGLDTNETIANPGEFLYDILTTSGVASETAPPLAYPTSKILLSPIPRVALSVRLEYYQVVPDLTADADAFGVLDPFIIFIENKAAAVALDKEGSGRGAKYEARAEAQKATIKAMLSSRQQQAPEMVEGFLEG